MLSIARAHATAQLHNCTMPKNMHSALAQACDVHVPMPTYSDPIAPSKAEPELILCLFCQAAAEPKKTKTWQVDMSGGGHNTCKTKIGNGPAPKRGFADLP